MSDLSAAPPVPAPRRVWNAPLVMALAAVALLLLALLILSFVNVPAGNKESLLQLIGTVGSGFTTAIAYFLGSSASSRAKDATISALSPPKA